MTKPVATYIDGRTAPHGKRMGHAGAIISGGKGTAAEKVAILEECGISVTASPAEMAQALMKVYKHNLHHHIGVQKAAFRSPFVFHVSALRYISNCSASNSAVCLTFISAPS